MGKFVTWMQTKKMLCICCFGLLCSILFGSLYIYEVSADEAYVCPKETLALESPAKEDHLLAVDIKGAIQNPGVYRVSADSIVDDVILLAGGLLENADTSNLNLSKKVTDEMMITIYTREEVEKLTKKDAIVEEYQDAVTKENGKISLNNATLEELMTLPGIGEAKAKLIIQYRDHCGPFMDIAELKYITGIGENIYAKVADYITI